jgi:hypothetical protein
MKNHPRGSSCQYIDFDGMQLEVRTSVPEIAEFIRAVYEHMLVPKSVRSAGRIRVMRSDSGYLFSSASEIEFSEDQLSLLLDMIREEVHLQFMRARPDLLWLHAAVVEKNGYALLISGRSGQGKSTLSTKLCERGWHLLSDDIAPTSMQADIVYPFPQAPRRRLFPGSVIEPHKIHTLDREQVVVHSHDVHLSPVPVKSIAYIEFMVDESATLERLTAGAAALELLRNSVNFGDHKEAAVARAATLGTRIPSYKLCYGSVTTAADHLESLL